MLQGQKTMKKIKGVIMFRKFFISFVLLFFAGQAKPMEENNFAFDQETKIYLTSLKKKLSEIDKLQPKWRFVKETVVNAIKYVAEEDVVSVTNIIDFINNNMNASIRCQVNKDQVNVKIYKDQPEVTFFNNLIVDKSTTYEIRGSNCKTQFAFENIIGVIHGEGAPFETDITKDIDIVKHYIITSAAHKAVACFLKSKFGKRQFAREFDHAKSKIKKINILIKDISEVFNDFENSKQNIVKTIFSRFNINYFKDNKGIITPCLTNKEKTINKFIQKNNDFNVSYGSILAVVLDNKQDVEVVYSRQVLKYFLLMKWALNNIPKASFEFDQLTDAIPVQQLSVTDAENKKNQIQKVSSSIFKLSFLNEEAIQYLTILQEKSKETLAMDESEMFKSASEIITYVTKKDARSFKKIIDFIDAEMASNINCDVSESAVCTIITSESPHPCGIVHSSNKLIDQLGLNFANGPTPKVKGLEGKWPLTLSRKYIYLSACYTLIDCFISSPLGKKKFSRFFNQNSQKIKKINSLISKAGSKIFYNVEEAQAKMVGQIFPNQKFYKYSDLSVLITPYLYTGKHPVEDVEYTVQLFNGSISGLMSDKGNTSIRGISRPLLKHLLLMEWSLNCILEEVLRQDQNVGAEKVIELAKNPDTTNVKKKRANKKKRRRRKKKKNKKENVDGSKNTSNEKLDNIKDNNSNVTNNHNNNEVVSLKTKDSGAKSNASPENAGVDQTVSSKDSIKPKTKVHEPRTSDDRKHKSNSKAKEVHKKDNIDLLLNSVVKLKSQINANRQSQNAVTAAIASIDNEVAEIERSKKHQLDIVEEHHRKLIDAKEAEIKAAEEELEKLKLRASKRKSEVSNRVDKLQEMLNLLSRDD